MLVDLHLHTTHSDGVWEPERLFQEIRSRALELFCVSDHDNVGAYPVPPDLRERVIPGLEVDSHHAGHTVHILAYGIGDPDSTLLQTLSAQRQARTVRMEAMIARVCDLGLHVTIDDVRAQAAGASSLGRPHLARALVARGHVETVQTAFDLYLADEGEGYVALERLSAARIIELIHESGGVAVVAHPMRLRSEAHLEELVQLGVDGIETIHPTADAAAQRRLEEVARQHGLLVTGGTDFHAPVPERPIGVELSDADVYALKDALAAMRSRRTAAFEIQ